MANAETDLQAVLLALAERDVDFIVIGGVAAVLQGAPIATFDLDIVHSRDPENVRRLLTALTELGAHYREQPARKLVPQSAHLMGAGHHLLLTKSGPLDVLGAVTGGRGYPELVTATIDLEVSPGLTVKVLDLATVIALKEELGGEKDRAVLPVLRRTLEERDRHD